MRTAAAVVLALTLLGSQLAPSIARAEDAPKPAPVHRGGALLGTFFNVFYSSDVRTRDADQAKLGRTEVNLGADVTLGFMLTDRWALMLNGGYSNDKVTTYSDTPNLAIVDRHSTGYVAPTVRYYLPANDQTYLFLQLKAPLALGALTEQSYVIKTQTIDSVDYKEKSVGLSLSPGVAAFLTDHLAAEALIGVGSVNLLHATSTRGFTRDRNDAKFLIFASSLNIGLVYYL